jgi:TonB family protein
VECQPTAFSCALGSLNKLIVAAAILLLVVMPLRGIATTKEDVENQLRDLWKDRPDYVAAVHSHTEPMRVVHAVAPTVVHGKRNTRAHVDVSFVLSPDGQVEDVRILNSTDHRLDQACMDAVRKSTFTHAEGHSGPELAIGVMPFNFIW